MTNAIDLGSVSLPALLCHPERRGVRFLFPVRTRSKLLEALNSSPDQYLDVEVIDADRQVFDIVSEGGHMRLVPTGRAIDDAALIALLTRNIEAVRMDASEFLGAAGAQADRKLFELCVDWAEQTPEMRPAFQLAGSSVILLLLLLVLGGAVWATFLLLSRLLPL